VPTTPLPLRPAPIPLKAGNLTCLFEPDSGWLRQIRHGDTEIVNAIYFAFRQPNWSTDPANIDPDSLEVLVGADRFDISFRTNAGGPYHVLTTISGDAGDIRYEIVFQPTQTVSSPRIGICVLHPPTANGYQVDYGDGNFGDWKDLPTLIWPHPPVTEISRLMIEASNLAYEFRFESQFTTQPTRRFEMEDQRNWGDASYKTYHSPLAKGGFDLSANEVLKQSIQIVLPSLPSLTASPASISAPALPSAFPAPRLGFPGQAMDLSALHGRGLTTLFARTGKSRTMDLDNLFSEACFLGLERILLQSGEVGGPILDTLKGALTTGPTTLLFDPAHHSGSGGLLPYASRLFGCGIGWLSPSNFTELNRARPWGGSADVLAWSYQPQAHSQDVLSILESPRALVDQFETARLSHDARSVILGPLDFRSSFDERLGSIAGAIWLTGVLAAISRSGVAVTHAILRNWAGWRDLAQDGATSAVFGVAIEAQGLGQSAVPTVGPIYGVKLGAKVVVATTEPVSGPVSVDPALQGKLAHFFFDPNNRADTSEVLGSTISHTGLWVAIIE